MTIKIYFNRIYAMCFFLFVFVNSFAQVWLQKQNLTAATSTNMSFSINGKGYVLIRLTNNLIEYDPAGDTWTTRAAFPGIPRENAVSFVIGNRGYIGTGKTAADIMLNDVWEYDAFTDTWMQRANFPGTPRQIAAAFSIGSKGYVGTGYDGSLTNDFWEYNPANDSWSPKASFGGGDRAMAVGFSIGSKGYFGTGTNGLDNTGLTNDFWEYDAVNNTWTQKASFGGSARVLAAGFSIGTKGYIGTGSGDIDGGPGPYYKDMWEYNPANNSWSSKLDYPGQGRFNLVAFSTGTNAYLGAGEGGTFFSDLWEFRSSYTTYSGQEFEQLIQPLGIRSLIDFNEIDASPLNNTFAGRTPFNGNHYSGSGITFVNPNSYNLYIAPTNAFTGNTSNSLSVYRFPGDPNFPPPPPYDDDDLNISLGTPCVAVGFTIIDNGSSTGGEFIQFLDANNEVISQASFPSVGLHVFIGFVSTNRPITAVKIIEGDQDNDDIAFDDFIFVKANSTTNVGEWVVKGTSPTPRRGEAAATLNGIVYVVGGAPPFSTSSVATAEAYNPATNSWTTLPSMPVASQQLTAQSVNGVVYAIAGGGCCGAYSDVQAYNPITNTWSLKTPAPTARYGATSAVVNNRIYVMSGGSGYGALYQDLEVYDPVTNSWTIKTPMPFFRGGCAAIAVNGIIYAIGGGDPSGTIMGTVQAYDPSSDSWSLKSDMPTPRGGLTVAVHNNKIYAIGGNNNTDGDIGIVEIYDPATDTWTSGPPLAPALQSLASATVNNKLYTFGGTIPAFPNSPVLTVEELTPACPVTESSTTVIACNQYLWNGVVYTTSGDKTYTTMNAAGCDSIATLHLTINHSTTSSTAVTACNQYLWNEVVYTTSGDKTYTTTNAAGCDSIATLHLTINQSTTSATTITTCDQYLWNAVVYTTSGEKTYATTNAAGCDSIATLHLTINHSTTSSTAVTACGQYLWNGVVYTTSGDKSYTTTNAAGCDSIATLHLTIFNGPTVPLITCPSGSPFTRSTNASCNYTIINGEFNATATATCGTPTLSYVLTGATTGAGSATLSGIVLNKGITTISWTATNGSLTSTCSFSVNVVDNQAPVITCPVNISTTLKGKNCNTKIKMLNPTYADNCGPITTLTWVMSGATSGSSPATGINNIGSQTFNAGVTTVVYTAKDAVGNSASCSFTVSVVNPNCPNSPITRISADLVKTKEFSIRDLTIIVNPNPSANYFTLRIESDNLEQKVSLRIFDLLGRLVETRNNLNSDQTLQIGHDYKSGIYMAEIIQDNRRRVVKLVKL